MGQDELAKMNGSWSRLSWLVRFLFILSPSWLLAARALRPLRLSRTTLWFTITGIKAWAYLIEPRSSTNCPILTSNLCQNWRIRRWTSWATCGLWRCTHIRETMIFLFNLAFVLKTIYQVYPSKEISYVFISDKNMQKPFLVVRSIQLQLGEYRARVWLNLGKFAK